MMFNEARIIGLLTGAVKGIGPFLFSIVLFVCFIIKLIKSSPLCRWAFDFIDIMLLRECEGPNWLNPWREGGCSDD